MWNDDQGGKQVPACQQQKRPSSMDRKLREQQRGYEIRDKDRCLERGYEGVDFCELLVCEGGPGRNPGLRSATGP